MIFMHMEDIKSHGQLLHMDYNKIDKDFNKI